MEPECPRQKRRPQSMMQNWQVHVQNLPVHFMKEDLVHFLYKNLQTCRGLIKPGNPIIQSIYLPEQDNTLVLNFRSYQQAVNCLFLDRVYYGQKVLSITSKFLQAPNQTHMYLQKLKKVSRKPFDDFKKIYVGNLPPMKDYQVMNILSEYGHLKSFVEIQNDKTSSECFCQYVDDNAIDAILKKLNSLKIKRRAIVAKRAALMITSQTSKTKIASKVVANRPTRLQKDLNDYYATFDIQGFFKNKKISCVLQLANIIPQLYANSNKQFILEDIKKQVERIGPIAKITSKRLNVYVEYQRLQYAQIAYLLLSQRKYDGKNLQVHFYDPIKFADDILL